MRTTRSARRQSDVASRRRCGGDAGAVLVEFALITPLLFLLLFGIVDWGLMLSDQIAMRGGVREAARRVVVADESASCGTGTFTANQKVRCFAKSRMGVDNVAVYVNVKGGTTPTVGQDIVVCAMAPMTSASGFLTPVMKSSYLSASTTMRVEQISGLLTGGDADPSGRGWSWCT